MKANCIVIFIFFVSCNAKKFNSTEANQLTHADSLKNEIIGNWGGFGESSPVWKIEPDSIYYYEEKKTYPYKILGKDLILQRPESKGVLRSISVVKDTMIFYDEQSLTVRAYRMKN